MPSFPLTQLLFYSVWLFKRIPHQAVQDVSKFCCEFCNRQHQSRQWYVCNLNARISIKPQLLSSKWSWTSCGSKLKILRSPRRSEILSVERLITPSTTVASTSTESPVTQSSHWKFHEFREMFRKSTPSGYHCSALPTALSNCCQGHTPSKPHWPRQPRKYKSNRVPVPLPLIMSWDLHYAQSSYNLVPICWRWPLAPPEWLLGHSEYCVKTCFSALLVSSSRISDILICSQLTDNHLHVKRERCEFHVNRMAVLRYIRAPEGWSWTRTSIPAHTNWPGLRTVKELQRFLR